MKLTNRVAVITGGATGIGAATAICFARAGARVVVGDINLEDGKKTVAFIQSDGGTARFVRTDVTVESEIANLIATTVQAFGRLDVLLTCAGILWNPDIRVDALDETAFESVIDVNLKGTFLAVKHVVPVMERTGGGVVLCVASGAGITGGSSSVSYGSSKGGVHGLVLTITPQLAPLNIRVHTVCPGGIKTPLKLGQIIASAERAGESPDAAVEGARPSLGEPSGVARVLAFLASDDASYVRGTIHTR
ncbi:MAG: SDR family NAD(P)-dependent oxidoreductase [Candidatus Poribacteria bacterium]|nr:SDR family NAD(P)-dependent oxidoreductase [Candidatus Poribacteria bacterium]